MSIGYTLFFSAITAYAVMLVIGFWIDKLGGGLSLVGYALVFVASAIVAFCFLHLAPPNIQAIALYIGIGIVTLTLIVNFISQS